MAKREIDQATMRRELKAMGYKVSCRAGTTFSTAKVSLDGETINEGTLMTPAFREKHSVFFDWRQNVSVVDNDGWRTVL